MSQKNMKKSVASIVTTFAFVALSAHGALAGAGSAGLKGKITATALVDGRTTRQIVATVEASGQMTTVNVWEYSDGQANTVTFESSFADLKGTPVTSGTRFKDRFEGGWGYNGTADFGHEGLQYDLGMVHWLPWRASHFGGRERLQPADPDAIRIHATQVHARGLG